MAPESLRRVVALAQSCLRYAEAELRRAGVDRTCRGQLLVEQLRRLAEALEERG
ncbi:hypothetical protein LVY65_07230 [Sphingomonas sp. G124]|uniref:Uncharacterized protein n=1 Tax=Sphingomonas cremea TaxID=2904799 RepID=A0A9X1TX73_9SPHN|nr:hypothetical protein [Sphingomonas cremea]MCF2514855.1 hypothetical protein [Sphingomonas cremea]